MMEEAASGISCGNAASNQSMLGQQIAYQPSLEETAKREAHEARYQRLQILEIAVRCTQVGEDVLTVATRIEAYLNGEAK